jgi:hypothetical protein
MKSLSKSSLIILGVILFFTNGCKTISNPTTPPTTSNNFTYAKVGNKWIYATSNQTQTLPDATTEVIKDMGNNIFKVVSTFPGSSFGDVISYWYVKGEEIAFYCDSTGTYKDLIVNSSTKADVVYSSVIKYKYAPWMQIGDTVRMKIASFDTQVTVPAGTFTCAKIYIWSSDSVHFSPTEAFVSKTAGTIKQSNKEMTMELKSKNF